jgi:aspartyl/asparaginyl beta-hydroxylase (cupin superfamily)
MGYAWLRMPTLPDRIGTAVKTGLKAILVPPIGVFYGMLYNAAGRDQRPVFYDIDQTAPALRELDMNYSVIRSEVEALLTNGVNVPRYHDVDPTQQSISGGEKKWRVFVLNMAGAKPKANTQLCPRTAALLDRIPNLFQAFFSILEGGKSVPAHGGPYYGAIRYHLGLVVPKENPPSIRIKDQFYTWKERESVLFDDTWNHQVFNDSSGDRVILLVDTLRPLPWYLHLMNFFYAKVFLRVAFASKLLQNAEKFR